MTGRQKTISGNGDGKWETVRGLRNYRRRRVKRNAAAKVSRKRNR